LVYYLSIGLLNIFMKSAILNKYNKICYETSVIMQFPNLKAREDTSITEHFDLARAGKAMPFSLGQEKLFSYSGCNFSFPLSLAIILAVCACVLFMPCLLPRLEACCLAHTPFYSHFPCFLFHFPLH